MNLQDNDFLIFGIEPRFAVDPAALQSRWKELQSLAHPDKFALQGAAEQRVAMQWSIRVNEAYQRLRDPIRRAAYLCELRGGAVGAETDTAMPPEFLQQQIEWREALEEAADQAALDGLAEQVQESKARLLGECEHLLDEAPCTHEAAQRVRALMFVERFGHEVEEQLARMSRTPTGPA